MFPIVQRTLLLLLATSAAQADTPLVKVEDPQNLVTGVHTLPIKGALSGKVQTALVHDGDLYVAGTHRSKEQEKTSLWLWRIGPDGEVAWRTTLGEVDPDDIGSAVIELLREVDSGSIRVLYRGAFQTFWATVDPKDGSHTCEPISGRIGQVALVLEERDLLICDPIRPEGTPAIGKARITRRTSRGEIVWSRDFSPNLELPQPDPGLYASTLFSTAVALSDGNFAIAGQTGNYSKFGVGQSWTWLLKLSPEGETLATRLLEDAYLNQPRGDAPLACRDKSLWLRYYRQIAPTDQAERPVFQRRLARFDSALKPVSDHPLTERLTPNRFTLTSEPLSFFPMEIGKTLVIAEANQEGRRVGAVRIDLAGSGLITPCCVASDATTLCAVADFYQRDDRAETLQKQMLLIFLKRGE